MAWLHQYQKKINFSKGELSKAKRLTHPEGIPILNENASNNRQLEAKTALRKYMKQKLIRLQENEQIYSYSWKLQYPPLNN